jgi:hypothetical protein
MERRERRVSMLTDGVGGRDNQILHEPGRVEAWRGHLRRS